MQKSRGLSNLLFFFLIYLIVCSNIFAQPFSIRTSVGFVHLPFNDWSKFFGEMSDSYYSNNNPNLYYGLSIHYSLNSNHTVNIATEFIKSSASMSSSIATVDWKFQGVPITLGYEYKVLGFNDHSIILGAGVSYFISKVIAHDSYFNNTLRRYGNGYGVHTSMGLNAKLIQKLSMISQIRYRYSDGMAFTDKEGSTKVEFTGFDFSTGLSWSF